MTGPLKKPSRGGARGRGRGRGTGSCGSSVAARPKHLVPDDSDHEPGPATKKTRSQENPDTDVMDVDAPSAAPIARERRSTVGSNMAALVEFVKPRAKHTHTQVVEDNEKVAEAAELCARIRQAHLEKVAKLEVELAKALAEEDENAVNLNSLDDLPSDAFKAPADENQPILEITQEDFDRIEDDDAYQSVSEYEKPKQPKPRSSIAAPKKIKKPEKGQTRRAIEAAAKKLEAGIRRQSRRKNWTKKAAAAQVPAVGGLTDEDATATRPDFGERETGRAPRLAANERFYRALLSSDDPMRFNAIGNDPESPGKEIVAVLQGLLDELYPNTAFRLTWGDAICSRVVIASANTARLSPAAVKNLWTAAFKLPSTTLIARPGVRLTTGNVVSHDARYALRQDGPAFYKNLTPEDCKLDPKHRDYIKPRGFLEGKVIIAAVSQVIAEHEWQLDVYQDADGNDVADWSNLPIGALGMAAAAAEHAYKSYSTGKFTPSRWESVIKACGANISDSAADLRQDQDESLDGIREVARTYIASSPPH
ncbi:hypothetical protein GGX14DRAFT_559527 [Mycena pura]|uniref:Uncharacterized protein n=1 Tax=Mycena pura TaxID=153505 RepID=A0AAD6YK19_9AGAR|nr:hypothetical protein GGX14DRAFT_559527 [Mycena pura]